MLMDSLNREKPEQLYREEEKKGWVNEEREGSQSVSPEFLSFDSCSREGRREADNRRDHSWSNVRIKLPCQQRGARQAAKPVAERRSGIIS